MTDASARRFQIHACLGRGGFGEVYRATMISPGGVRNEVAVKVLRPDVDPSSEAVRRLRDEGRLLGLLSHPAILTVHDLVLLGGRVALVTEFVEGQDLDQTLRGPDRIGLRALLGVIGEVAAALDVAWNTMTPEGQRMGLVHRDVKPANIRLGRHGEVKLLDFGIARATSLKPDAQTAEGSVVGSTLYMAPERFHDESVAPPSDVYSLGCVLFEGLSGQGLFEGLSLKQVYGIMLLSRKLQAHVEERSALLPADTPGPVRELLSTLLDPKPAARPTARDLARRCEDLADAQSGPTLKRWARERTWPPTASIVGVLDGRELSGVSFDGTLAAFPPPPPLEVGPVLSPDPPTGPLDAPPLATSAVLRAAPPPPPPPAPLELPEPPVRPVVPPPPPEGLRGLVVETPETRTGLRNVVVGPAPEEEGPAPTVGLTPSVPPPRPTPVTTIPPAPPLEEEPTVLEPAPALVAPDPLFEPTAGITVASVADETPTLSAPPAAVDPDQVDTLLQVPEPAAPPEPAEPTAASDPATTERAAPSVRPLAAPPRPSIASPRPPGTPSRPPPRVPLDPLAEVVVAPTPIPGVFDDAYENSFDGALVLAERKQQAVRRAQRRKNVAMGAAFFAVFGIGVAAAFVAATTLDGSPEPTGLVPVSGDAQGRVPSEVVVPFDADRMLSPPDEFPLVPPPAAAPSPAPARPRTYRTRLETSQDPAWALINSDPRAALARFDALLEASPRSAEAHYGKGLALMQMARAGEAVESLCMAIRLGDDEIDREVRGLLQERGLRCP